MKIEGKFFTVYQLQAEDIRKEPASTSLEPPNCSEGPFLSLSGDTEGTAEAAAGQYSLLLLCTGAIFVSLQSQTLLVYVHVDPYILLGAGVAHQIMLVREEHGPHS